jgi:hypothetical protein
LFQDAYTKRILAKYGMDTYKGVTTPIQHHFHQLHPDLERAGAQADKESYQSLIGSLLFLSVQTRPDLTFAVGWFSRHCHQPSALHEQGTKHILRYLQGTIALGITFSEGDIQGFSDASFAEDPETRRSTSGYLFKLAGGPISWRSSRQELVTTSSTEAEYVGYSSAAKDAAWIQALLQELEIPIKQIPLYVDNRSAIALAENSGYRARTKHIDVRYHYIRQQVQNGQIKLEYLPTAEMPADGLTKPLNTTLFRNFIKGLNLTQVKLS